MNDIDTRQESTEVKCFNVTQFCTASYCDNGEFRSIGLMHKDKHIHECSVCERLKAFENKYPRLEYEEVEALKIVASETGVYANSQDAFDDDIPF